MSDGKDERSDPRLEARAKQLFDSSVAGLGAGTRSKLAQARTRAVGLGNADSHATIRRPGRRTWLPAGVAAAAAVTALLVWRGFYTPQPLIEALAFDDLEIVLGEDEFEMLEELEFYAWLEEQPELEIPAPPEDGVG